METRNKRKQSNPVRMVRVSMKLVDAKSTGRRRRQFCTHINSEQTIRQIEALVRKKFQCASDTQVHMVWHGETLATGATTTATDAPVLSLFDLHSPEDTIDVHLIERADFED